MATLLRMPEVAANATSATLLSWHKKPGDAVAAGELLAEIESEKAVVEFTAESAGTLGRVLLADGCEAEVGAPIAVLLAAGETEADATSLLASVASEAPAAPAEATTAAQPAGAAAPAGQRILASPLARRLARERGLDLAGVAGSGPGGRIVKRDVEAMGTTSTAQAAATAAVQSAGASPYHDIPHSGMRRTIARRLSESKASVPHFYLTVECRVDRLLALRGEFNATAPRRVSINDFIVRAVAIALRNVPEANVAWTDTALRRFEHADIAVAVAIDDGLITPIVRQAEHKSLSAISAEIAALAERARRGGLKPDEYQGGSFSVSNLGMRGIDGFAAIVNPPQAAILAVGAVQRRPVVEGEAVVAASVLRCTLSVDHRAIDGALAAQWLAEFRRVVEAPLALLS